MSIVPDELVEQFVRGNVLLFIGEEATRDRDSRVVDDLITAELAERVNFSSTKGHSFPEIAQLYEEQQGRHALVQYLLRRYEELGSDEPQQLHHLIAGLTTLHALVTTCLDRSLEHAFEDAARPLDVIVGTLDVAFEESERTELFKLHGSLERPDTLILTEDDNETFFDKQETVSVILQAYLARKTILFLGYTLDDPAFRTLYRKVTGPLDRYARRSYVVGEALSSSAIRWGQRHGIQAIQSTPVALLETLTSEIASLHHSPSAVRQAVSPNAYGPIPKHPYKLLDYYEPQDSSIFYGRQRKTQELISLVLAHRLVVLYGASGVGKTSLLLAGMVPVVESADPPYEAMYVRTLDDPAQAMRRILQRQLRNVTLPEKGSLVDFLSAAVQGLGRPLIIIFDQFEEFFIRLSSDARQSFIAELGELYDAYDVAVKIVLSLREDWLASISEIETRIPAVFRTHLRLLPMTREEASQAITGPVEHQNVRYEPALLARLIDDLEGVGGTDVMPPQLQLVCSALYNGLEQNERVITLASYKGLGETRGVLHRYLDEELSRFGAEERRLARSILEGLITSQQTKRLVTLLELERAVQAEEQAVDPVLEKLLRARLVRQVSSSALDEAAYELAHEYLIEQIAVSPEVRARKKGEELLKQGLENWRRYQTLLAEDAIEIIESQRPYLRLSPEEEELLDRSSRRLARRSDKIVRGMVGGLAGGAFGGLMAGWIATVLGRPSSNDLVAQIAAYGIVFALFGGLVGLAYALSKLPKRWRNIYPLIAGAVAGAIVAIPLAVESGWSTVQGNSLPSSIVVMLISGVVYAAGICGSAGIGGRWPDAAKRISAWLLLGALAGFASGLLNALLRLSLVPEDRHVAPWHLAIPAVTAATIATGVGLVVEGLRRRVVYAVPPGGVERR